MNQYKTKVVSHSTKTQDNTKAKNSRTQQYMTEQNRATTNKKQRTGVITTTTTAQKESLIHLSQCSPQPILSLSFHCFSSPSFLSILEKEGNGCPHTLTLSGYESINQRDLRCTNANANLLAIVYHSSYLSSRNGRIGVKMAGLSRDHSPLKIGHLLFLQEKKILHPFANVLIHSYA